LIDPAPPEITTAAPLLHHSPGHDLIVLRAGHQPVQRLTEEIQEHVRARLSLHAYPREIEYLDQLPKTPSGKVQRFVLRQRIG